ncbi:PREDICTED: proline-rich receptor-like protein kinase PERK7 [Nicrophorus vespilloides]|uniref:Proline-rich receptor-like protein kinase PERK7 n=1 Tax=Nicrophorus vespilloides TaxID=110193 RepID=A0ABM1MMD0_NICVS|nr:PREDICTED: proline-rich receptor-like protein kinase PERK7 [Nicrophorus vespilloides]
MEAEGRLRLLTTRRQRDAPYQRYFRHIRARYDLESDANNNFSYMPDLNAIRVRPSREERIAVPPVSPPLPPVRPPPVQEERAPPAPVEEERAQQPEEQEERAPPPPVEEERAQQPQEQEERAPPPPVEEERAQQLQEQEERAPQPPINPRPRLDMNNNDRV